jgi:transcriptional regulator with XRE-family HTH domain
MSYSEKEQEYLRKVGGKIREIRIALEISQEKLASDSNLDRTYIGSIERGERNLSVLNLLKISNALKTNPSEILNL